MVRGLLYFDYHFRQILDICKLIGYVKFNKESSICKKKFSSQPVDTFSYLRSIGVSFKDGYSCIQIHCKLCDLGCQKNYAFINKLTREFMCPSCERNLPFKRFLEIYEKGMILSSKIVEYKSKAVNVSNVSRDISNRLKIPVKAAVLNSMGTKFNRKDNSLHFPLKNAAGKVVGERILNCENHFENYLPKNSSGLIVHDKNQKRAILVSNMLDFLSLISQKIERYSIVCVPFFSKTVPNECLPGLETYNKIILWLAPQPNMFSPNLLTILDPKRCFMISSSESACNAQIALKKGLNIKAILQSCQPVIHKSILTFAMLKNDILNELRNNDEVNGIKWTRFPILNKLLKGHRKGELTILTGMTGCGKTTFMSEYSLDLALQGVPTLWGSFEIRNSRLGLTLLRQFVGYSLADKLNEFEVWAKEMEKYPLYFMTFHGQQNIKNVMEAVNHAQYVLNISHVIIDNVQFMIGNSSVNKNDKFWEQDNVIATFRKFATEKNVHVTLIMHPRKEREIEELTINSIFGSAKATQEADNVLIIQDKKLSSIKGRKFLQIAKNRYSGDLGMMPLNFNPDGLNFGKKEVK